MPEDSDPLCASPMGVGAPVPKGMSPVEYERMERALKEKADDECIDKLLKDLGSRMDASRYFAEPDPNAKPIQFYFE